MAKVHPNSVAPEPTTTTSTTTCSRAAAEDHQESPTVQLTVWRKSLLFNCDGFTVFDAKGDLAFRVDCYASARRRAEVVLMDVAGKPLLTVRRKRLVSLVGHCWVIYDGDAAAAGGSKSKPLLSVRRHVSLRRSSSSKKPALAYVTPLPAPGALDSSSAAAAAAYVVEGSYGQRACTVREAARGGAVVAEVRRKESVGDDVFRLVVADPGRLGAALAMGLVIALDEMFGAAARSLLPRTWSA